MLPVSARAAANLDDYGPMILDVIWIENKAGSLAYTVGLYDRFDKAR